MSDPVWIMSGVTFADSWPVGGIANAAADKRQASETSAAPRVVFFMSGRSS
jgi:hypothetical protein